ncbi:hypothetical protein BDN71DRAFT_1436232 [Pleurotus eryngii]|uniref:NGN domain-containing protein n=1 Tax=Pleurotus eryngii TaxID=5323 RepID=A0A9P5ZHC4_PLEER|nr:hypothetical protein BDN71DRAFT_1436232 [Pleurotus eryngii]
MPQTKEYALTDERALWCICLPLQMPGRELVVVVTIFNKALALQIDGVNSAFYREGIPGVVYIEAHNYGAVLTILKGINNVWLQYYKAEGRPIDLVPISERLALLTLDISPVNEVEKAVDKNQLAIIGGYVMDTREALVLVILCAGTSRHFAVPPALKRAAPIAGDLKANSLPFLTSNSVDNLQLDIIVREVLTKVISDMGHNRNMEITNLKLQDWWESLHDKVVNIDQDMVDKYILTYQAKKITV